MPMPESPLALPTARGLLDQALEAPNGLKAEFPTHGQAFSMLMQCYTARSRDRKRNARIYPPEHRLHRASAYDCLELHLETPDGERRTARSGDSDARVLVISRALSHVKLQEF